MRIWSRRDVGKRSRLLTIAAIVIAGAMTVALGFAQTAWQEVADLFAAARYGEAREASERLQADGDSGGEALIWRLRLASETEAALAVIRDLEGRDDLPQSARESLAVEEAQINFANGRYPEALAPLERLIDTAGDRLPGRVSLMAGLCYLALDKTQKSRQSFANIVSDDPAYPWARFYLGRIALDGGDPNLALRYFESAQNSPLGERQPSLLVGIWEALTRSGQLDEADRIRGLLQNDHPNSLATVQLRELIKREELTVPDWQGAVGDSGSTGADTQPDPGARFELQLAAFSDRGRALAYLAEWQRELPDIRVMEQQSEDDRILYRVRTGRFTSRSQARVEAERLQRTHDLDVIIVEGDR